MPWPAWLPAPDPARYQAPVRRWLVLEQPPSPTADYYIRPRAAQAGVPVAYRSIGEPPRAEDLVPGTLVVVVRYLSRAWAEALVKAAPGLAGLVYLMDDDLLDPSTWRALPLGYQGRLWRHGVVLWPLLRRWASAYWMSTPALVQRYAWLRPRLLEPLPLCEDRQAARVACAQAGSADAARLLLFYHGTRSHLAEMAWLRPIVAEALAACPQLHFEIIGEAGIQRRFRDLPRTRVLHPLPWPAYLAHCRWLAEQQQGREGQLIGLAPLLPSAFNAVRSHSKLFDMARCGAIGLYADRPPYAGRIRHDQDGLLLPATQPQAWVEAIMALCADPARRRRLALEGGQCLESGSDTFAR